MMELTVSPHLREIIKKYFLRVLNFIVHKISYTARRHLNGILITQQAPLDKQR